MTGLSDVRSGSNGDRALALFPAGGRSSVVALSQIDGHGFVIMGKGMELSERRQSGAGVSPLRGDSREWVSHTEVTARFRRSGARTNEVRASAELRPWGKTNHLQESEGVVFRIWESSRRWCRNQ